ncbi:unnamed protein product [Rhizophagus irregularis]|nr:unnamed protein product [Rhizophagus irregularis]
MGVESRSWRRVERILNLDLRGLFGEGCRISFRATTEQPQSAPPGEPVVDVSPSGTENEEMDACSAVAIVDSNSSSDIKPVNIVNGFSSKLFHRTDREDESENANVSPEGNSALNIASEEAKLEESRDIKTC